MVADMLSLFDVSWNQNIVLYLLQGIFQSNLVNNILILQPVLGQISAKRKQLIWPSKYCVW